MLLQSMIIFRIETEYLIPHKQPNEMTTIDQIAKYFLQWSIHLEKEIKKVKRRQLVSVDKCIEKGTYDMSQLSPQLLHSIFQYLPMEDLYNCQLTCKRFYQVIENDNEIWKNFYDLYFNSETSNKRNDIENFEKYHPNENIQNETQRKELYIQKVQKSQQNQVNWRTYTTRSKKQIQFFATNDSVDYIFLGNSQSNDYVLVSSVGKMKQCNYINDHPYKNYYLYKPIKTSSYIPSTQTLLYAFGDGEIQSFDLQTAKYTPIMKQYHDNLKFLPDDQYLIGWDDKTVHLYNMTNQKQLNTFTHHSEKVTGVDQVQPNVFITTSMDQRLCLFDIRTKQLVFETKHMGSGICSFDHFDNYLVCGSCVGYIDVLDLRNYHQVSRHFVHSSPITQLKCYNRKCLFSTDLNTLGYYECNYGILKEYHNLYQHKHKITSIECNDYILMSGSENGDVIVSHF